MFIDAEQDTIISVLAQSHKEVPGQSELTYQASANKLAWSLKSLGGVPFTKSSNKAIHVNVM